jgi:hypothetical protein
VPSEPDFEALRHPIVRQAPNPSVVNNGVVIAGKWFHEVLTVNDPMPTAGAPV